MRANMRPYQNEDDYWRIRAFLREVSLLSIQVTVAVLSDGK